jgi:hypothetical protein
VSHGLKARPYFITPLQLAFDGLHKQQVSHGGGKIGFAPTHRWKSRPRVDDAS